MFVVFNFNFFLHKRKLQAKFDLKIFKNNIFKISNICYCFHYIGSMLICVHNKIVCIQECGINLPFKEASYWLLMKIIMSRQSNYFL